MAALLRGAARRSFAVVSAAAPLRKALAAQAITDFSLRPSSALPISAGVIVRGEAAAAAGGRGIGILIAASEKSRSTTTGMAASLPGLLGSGALAAARPAAPLMVVSTGQAQHPQHPLSSSAAFLAHHRLTMRPQMTHVSHGSNPMLPFQIISHDGQGVSVEESNGAPPSQPVFKHLLEKWESTRSGDMDNRYTPQRKSNVFPRNRYASNAVSSGRVLENSKVYRRSASTPLRPAREFSSSAVIDGLDEIEGSRPFSSSAALEGFDDNEGSDMDVETYKRTHEISTTGDNVPDPVMTFASTGFPPALMRELQNAGFSSPSAIQAMTWPIASQNRDVVAVAKTGSGKTLGYLMPAFLRLEKEARISRRAPSVLVLAPTRELANQIRDEAWKFGRSSRIAVTCVCGGTSKGPQLRDIERGVDVLVATPGRLNDLLEMRAVDLRKVSYLVLDEADRMLDMGFEPQIRAIVDEMSPKRQTLMYTATWPQEVRRIARDLLTDPVQVNIGNSDQLSANKNITQRIEIISRFEKERRLDEILATVGSGAKVLIFCTTKRMCDELTFNLRNKFGALALHGDKSQRERDYVMLQFKRGRAPILVATDVAARGLDIKDIRMVINYDFPTGVEDYVHRIGRTGRAGATGVAHTFFGFEDAKHAGELVKVLESTGQEVIPELRDMVGRGGRGGSSRWGSGGRGGGGFRGSNSGSKWGNSGGDRFGSSDRYGSGRFGSDRIGSDRSGGDRYGGGSGGGSGGDWAGGRNGRQNSRGSDRVGTMNSGSNKSGQSKSYEYDIPTPKWEPDFPSLPGYGKQEALLPPGYGQPKLNPDGSFSLW